MQPMNLWLQMRFSKEISHLCSQSEDIRALTTASGHRVRCATGVVIVNGDALVGNAKSTTGDLNAFDV